MPMHRIIVITVIAFLVLGTLNARGTWKPDKAHSQVNFTVTHMVISEVTGSFKDFDAALRQPGKDDFSGSSVEAVVNMASISTGNDKRDAHLRSDDFFNVGKYPEMKFKSTAFEKTGENTYKIAGNLTIRDVTKPVVLDAKMTGMVEAWGAKHVGFKATATIDRFDYGVKWDKTLETGGLVVGKNVDVSLLFEFVQQKEEAEETDTK